MSLGSIHRGLLRGGAFFLLLLLVFAAVYFWLFNPLALGRPKDQTLVRIFRDHRRAFERLRSMAVEDSPVISYINEESLNKSSLSKARRDEYLVLLREISQDLSIGAGSHQVTFHFAGGGVGLAIARSWTEGITYLPIGAEKGCVVVRSLEGLGIRNDGVYIAPIEGNWYLIYSNLD